MKKIDLCYIKVAVPVKEVTVLEDVCRRDTTGFCLILGSNAVLKLTQQAIPNMKLFQSQNYAVLF